MADLAEIAGLDLDDTLLTLWQAGLAEVNDPSDILVGARLRRAHRALSIPDSSQLSSLTYWQRVLSVNEEDLRALLTELGVSMSTRSRKLPKGAIHTLRSFLTTPSKPPTPERTVIAAQTPIISESSFEAPSVEIRNDQKPPQKSIAWKIIGQRRDVRHLTLEEVLGIHYSLVQDFRHTNNPITPPGPRSETLIGSAVFRQQTSAGIELKYPTVEMSAAALLHSLVHNHPFHNGNKRTALVSMLVLLDENDLMVTCSEDNLFQFVIQVSQHRIVDGPADLSDREVLAISEWIKSHSRSVERGERPIPFRKLRPILSKYGCNFEHSAGGSNMKITRTIAKGGLLKRVKTATTNISYGGSGRDVLVSTINKIRAELLLDEDNGIDSAAFYADLPISTDEFIVKYRKILNRLAKL